MSDDVPDKEAVIEIAEEYADTECVGEFGDIVEVDERENEWIIVFRTHTFSDAYSHRIRITSAVGNVVAHERSNQFE